MSALDLLAEPRIIFAWGMPYADFWAEAEPLLRAHSAEVNAYPGVLGFDIDHDRYRFAERSKTLHLLTAHDRGKLVGYFALSVGRHSQDKSILIGIGDALYAHPDYRRMHLGTDLIRRGIDCMREVGVNIMTMRDRLDRGNGDYLKRFGFVPQEISCSMILKQPVRP